MSVTTLSQLQTSLERAKADTTAQVAECAQASAGAISELAAEVMQRPVQITIPATATSSTWVLDSGEATDYKWHYDIIVAGVDVTDVAMVTIAKDGHTLARRCGLCPTNETLSGKIRLRAKAVPPASIGAEYRIIPGIAPVVGNGGESS